MIKLLVEEHGVDPEARDSSGRTALHHAAAMDRDNLGYLLETLKVDANATSHAGDTPLHDLATTIIFQPIVYCDTHVDKYEDDGLLESAKDHYKLLRKMGADPSRRNAAGKTPWECLDAGHRNYRYLDELLRPASEGG